MTPKKVFTESMIRRIVKAHFEVEPSNPTLNTMYFCDCGWEGNSFEDHLIDQLHKHWHELDIAAKAPNRLIHSGG